MAVTEGEALVDGEGDAVAAGEAEAVGEAAALVGNTVIRMDDTTGGFKGVWSLFTSSAERI